AKRQHSRSTPRRLRCSGNMERCATPTSCTTSLTRSTASAAITSPARLEAMCGFRFTTCRAQFVIAYGHGSRPASSRIMTCFASDTDGGGTDLAITAKQYRDDIEAVGLSQAGAAQF